MIPVNLIAPGSDQRLQIGCRTFLGSLVLHPLLRQLVGELKVPAAGRHPKPSSDPRFVVSGGFGHWADDYEACSRFFFMEEKPKFPW